MKYPTLLQPTVEIQEESDHKEKITYQNKNKPIRIMK
jgi:hypothetical protein